MGWVGCKKLGLGWVKFKKSDPCPTLLNRTTYSEVDQKTLRLFMLADFENRSDRKIPDSVYSYASDDIMWRDVGLFLSHNDKRVVSKYTRSDCT